VNRSAYVGKAGHLAVMSELAMRGYNVAMPEIDKGDDVFAVNDATGALWRVQVKTATGSAQRTSTAYAFRIRQTAIEMQQNPELHFVFAMRADDRWRFLIIDRPGFHRCVLDHEIGALYRGYRRINITLHHDGGATAGGLDVSGYLGAWNAWPPIAE
jgi:hypothetical protein